jgi:hypothetical protein
MPSPFPGMDPYLEGYLWPDVHNALANKLRQLLTPRLRPRYTARLAIYVVEDSTPEAEIGIMYPDVEVLRSQHGEVLPETYGGDVPESISARTATVTPLTIPIPQPVEVRIPTVEIRDTAHNQLVTCIEILSPVNKREPGLTAYREKRQRLYQAAVHLIELDLLRRGTRPLAHPRIPPSPYLIALTRAEASAMTVWPIGLHDRLPAVPVPLRAPDPDVLLDVPAAIDAIYDEAAYDLSIDYNELPPPPPLTQAEIDWMRALPHRH